MATNPPSSTHPTPPQPTDLVDVDKTKGICAVAFDYFSCSAGSCSVCREKYSSRGFIGRCSVAPWLIIARIIGAPRRPHSGLRPRGFVGVRFQKEMALFLTGSRPPSGVAWGVPELVRVVLGCSAWFFPEWRVAVPKWWVTTPFGLMWGSRPHDPRCVKWVKKHSLWPKRYGERVGNPKCRKSTYHLSTSFIFGAIFHCVNLEFGAIQRSSTTFRSNSNSVQFWRCLFVWEHASGSSYQFKKRWCWNVSSPLFLSADFWLVDDVTWRGIPVATWPIPGRATLPNPKKVDGKKKSK